MRRLLLVATAAAAFAVAAPAAHAAPTPVSGTAVGRSHTYNVFSPDTGLVYEHWWGPFDLAGSWPAADGVAPFVGTIHLTQAFAEVAFSAEGSSFQWRNHATVSGTDALGRELSGACYYADDWGYEADCWTHVGSARPLEHHGLTLMLETQTDPKRPPTTRDAWWYEVGAYRVK